MAQDSRGNVKEQELQNKLNEETGKGKTEVSDIGEELEIIFTETNRYYNVSKNGTIDGPYKIVRDEYPGDITKNENGDELDGSEDNPYEIWCIEDLIEWSQNYSNYLSAFIKLGRTLNFKSNLSYVDGKKLNCNSVEELKKLLTDSSGIGYTPINSFSGTFDGQGYEIQNIYINSQNENVGFIAGVEKNKNLSIKNFGITGTIIGIKNVGGILGNAGSVAGGKYNTTISNCYNKANIYNYNTYTGVTLNGVGGIVGYLLDGNLTIENCYNKGNIYSASELNSLNYSGVGGILGKKHFGDEIVIDNCYNEGTIEGNGCRAGGIAGIGGLIVNSYNLGKIINGSGITGFSGTVINCFNSGETVNGIYGTNYATTITIKNVYTTATTSAFPIVNLTNSACTYDIANAFYSENCSQSDTRGTKISETLMKSDGSNDTAEEKALITLLNNFVDEYNNSENEIKLKSWKLGENGYPTFIE